MHKLYAFVDCTTDQVKLRMLERQFTSHTETEDTTIFVSSIRARCVGHGPLHAGATWVPHLQGRCTCNVFDALEVEI
jgi:hypothetical protein